MHPQGFTNAHHLALQIVESIIRKSLPALKIERNVNFDKIYLCDRKPQSLYFDRYLELTDEAIQFFLINSHQKDMPHFFVERKKLEFSESDIKTIELLVH